MDKLIRHEKPLSKTDEHGNNPNKITVDQHVIPCKHLLEWSPNGRMVKVFDIKEQNIKSLPAASSYFCVMRLWDQWTESVMLKTNEDNYQDQVELIRRNGGKFIENSQPLIEYYVLLCVRILVANKERPHYPSMYSSVFYESDQSELECNELEMQGSVHLVMGTKDPNSQHDARQVVKILMSQTFTNFCQKMKEYKWRIYQSDSDDFILSDAIYSNFLNGFHVMPMNPKQILIAEKTYERLEKEGKLSAEFINNKMKKNAVKYYLETPFTKDFKD